MHCRVLTFIALLLLLACHGAGSLDAGPGEVAAPVAVAPDAGWALSASLLDGYVRYQRALLSADGGAALLVRARQELLARQQAGLSADDVAHFEAMLSAVVARRAVMRITSTDLPLPDLEKLSAGLSPEQRAQAQAALEGLKKASEAGRALPAERAQFGEANITLLLTREAELSRNWEALMQVPLSR